MHVESKVVWLLEAESRMVVAQGWEGGGNIVKGLKVQLSGKNMRAMLNSSECIQASAQRVDVKCAHYYM